MKFKAGDRVKCLADYAALHKEGLYLVMEADAYVRVFSLDDMKPVLGGLAGPEQLGGWFEHHFELVEDSSEIQAG